MGWIIALIVVVVLAGAIIIPRRVTALQGKKVVLNGGKGVVAGGLNHFNLHLSNLENDEKLDQEFRDRAKEIRKKVLNNIGYAKRVTFFSGTNPLISIVKNGEIDEIKEHVNELDLAIGRDPADGIVD